MLDQQVFAALAVAHPGIARGVVVAGDGRQFVVEVARGDESWVAFAELLVTSASPVRIEPGDEVLCALDADDHERGVVLGRIGGAAAAEAPAAPREADAEPQVAAAPAADVPDTLVIEARRSLTLRVGEGSITLREDGKILIKGRDLVSHAQRANRIKGGSVAIN